jgi:hypothetical protein
LTEKKPEDKFTIRELHDRFNGFRRIKAHGTVLISFKGTFIELKEDFVHQLKRELDNKIKIASVGIDELSKTDIFCLMILEDSY